MNKKLLAAVLAALTLAAFSGCKKNDRDEVSSSEDTEITSSVAEQSVSPPLEEKETTDMPKKVLSPYDYPYEPDKIQADLISYGEKLGLLFDDEITMMNATSITNNQTRAAATGDVLEKWCKKDIDSIEKLAKYQNVDVGEVSFNVIIYDSPDYSGEYIIGIYAEQ